MFRDLERYGKTPTAVVRTSRATFEKPLKWQREAERGERTGTDRLVFTCSWSDWFLEQADPWREEMWAIIRECPLLTFQVLTKRADRIADHLPEGWGEGWPNVWLGVSVEDQAMADGRIPHLLRCPAAVRFLSVEPLLGPVNLGLWRVAHPKHDGRWPTEEVRNFWVIVGGESGTKTGRYRSRPCDIDWIRSVIRQCAAAGVPCFVKQLGSDPRERVKGPEFGLPEGTVADGYSWSMRRRDTHGGDPSEWPADLRIREFPEVSVI